MDRYDTVFLILGAQFWRHLCELMGLEASKKVLEELRAVFVLERSDVAGIDEVLDNSCSRELLFDLYELLEGVEERGLRFGLAIRVQNPCDATFSSGFRWGLVVSLSVQAHVVSLNGFVALVEEGDVVISKGDVALRDEHLKRFVCSNTRSRDGTHLHDGIS